VDAYTENTQHSFVDNTSGNLIIRFPFDAIRLAPYVFGGAGYQFDPTGLWLARLGAGWISVSPKSSVFSWTPGTSSLTRPRTSVLAVSACGSALSPR